MRILFADKAQPKTHSIVLVLEEGKNLSPLAKQWDAKLGGAIARAVKNELFKAKRGEAFVMPVPTGTELAHCVLLGMGNAKECKTLNADTLGGQLYATLDRIKAKEALVFVDEGAKTPLKKEEFLARLAHGARLRSYRFDLYKTKPKEESKPKLTSLTFVSTAKREAEARFTILDSLAEGVSLARNLVTEPPNILHPESYAERCKELSKLGVKVTILDRKQLEKLGFGALLGVAQGSVREARMVVLEWRGNPKDKKTPIALVGKGVTFDTGGISIKPSSGMEDMKYDMGGSAAVVGALRAVAGRKAKVNVVGLIGLVENMPDGNAQRPSDVVKSYSGQTVEVLNTDAEGRLVLCDVLWYAQEKFKPTYVVDLATLTGAIVVSLGGEYAGLFSNDDGLSKALFDAGMETGERLWRFPMGEEYDKMIDSEIADMANISQGRGAGSITAAQFLKRFIQKDTKWAHLDIAGCAWTKKDQDLCPKGAVGFGVRVLSAWIETQSGK